MARSYKLKKRAEQQEATRLKIVEAAVELHGTVGPAATTVSLLADRAGVQRHTVYAHFPDEGSLLLACSGLAQERDPMPDATPWRDIADRGERIRTGLTAIYRWYERNAGLTANVVRDAEYHQPTKDIVAFRIAPRIAAYRDILGEGLDEEGQIALGLALDFGTWRNLARSGGLDAKRSAGLMAKVVSCVGRGA
ncbi:MAG: TetR/AcrR family transcriptional regulator [Bauldia sp.]|nr:TetR/AcrR family transcriptional regulator [Bauldia sp.]